MIYEMFSQYMTGLAAKAAGFLVDLLIAALVLVIGLKVVKKFLLFLRKSLLRKNIEPGLVSFLISTLKIILYILLVIMAAQVLGFAASSAVAIVGSAGLAVGLAIQGSLANFAGGVLILFMKPFVVGDYIIVGDVEGTVQKIDVVYTTLSMKDNRAVILPNGRLADSNIVNATKEDKRRIDIRVGIEYSEDIGRVRDVLQAVVESQPERMDGMPTDIVVDSLGESAVEMMVFLWVKPEDYLPVKCRMLEQIKEQFDRNGITIPYNRMDVTVLPPAAESEGK